MLDLRELTTEQIAALGIVFEDDEVAEAFRAHILEEAEVRIGERISEGLTQEELFELDMIDTEASAKWFADHDVDTVGAVEAVAAELEKELILSRSKIAGALRSREIMCDLTPVSELFTNAVMCRALENAGIRFACELIGIPCGLLPVQARAHIKKMRQRLVEHYRIREGSPMLGLPFFGGGNGGES